MIAIVFLVVGALVAQGHAACETATTAFSSAEQQAIVDKHNGYRSTASPSASDMMPLEWDDALAQRAQAWANTCTWDHGMTSACDGTGLGQNLYMTTGTMNGVDGVRGWWEENTCYTYATKACVPVHPITSCGHYTQVMWSTSTKVGCGWKDCTDTPAGGKIFACNYQPQGNFNMATTPIYKSGAACSACPFTSGGQKCVNNMCVACAGGDETGCSCPFTSCENGGVFTSATCTCACATGYEGRTCDVKTACKNLNSGCESWKSDCAESASWYSWMQTNCITTCGFTC